MCEAKSGNVEEVHHNGTQLSLKAMLVDLPTVGTHNMTVTMVVKVIFYSLHVYRSV